MLAMGYTGGSERAIWSSRRVQELAVDPGLWRDSASNAKLSHAKSRSYLNHKYGSSKMRVRRAYAEARDMSFGIRMEFRVDWPLFQAIKQLAVDREGRAALLLRLTKAPSSAPGRMQCLWDLLGRISAISALRRDTSGLTVDRELVDAGEVHVNENRRLAWGPPKPGAPEVMRVMGKTPYEVRKRGK